MLIKKQKDVIVIFIILLSAFLEVFIYSSTTTPLSHGNFYMIDESLFELIGREWAKGAVPYVDIWDSKGPYVFFINMIAYRFLGGRPGIFILEILNLFVTKLLIYKTCRIYTDWLKSLFITSFAVSLFAVYTWFYGNIQSEWCLPYLSASAYGLFRWAEEENDGHDPKYAFIYGITIAVCILTRMTNAAPVVFVLPGVFIYLISKKKYSDIIKNLAAGFSGVLIPVAVFSVWFCSKGALWDMWNAAVIYNIDYMRSHPVLLKSPKLLISAFVMYLFPMVSGIPFMTEKNHGKRAAVGIGVTAAAIYIMIKTFAFRHYFTIFLPFMTVLFTSAVKQKVATLLITAIQISILINYAAEGGFLYRNPAYTETIAEIQEDLYSTYVEPGASFLCVNDPVHILYLKHDITPAGKYPYFQDDSAAVNEWAKQEKIQDLRNHMPEYVMYHDGQECILSVPKTIRDSVYGEILTSEYDVIKEVKAEDQTITLLRRKPPVSAKKQKDTKAEHYLRSR